MLGEGVSYAGTGSTLKSLACGLGFSVKFEPLHLVVSWRELLVVQALQAVSAQMTTPTHLQPTGLVWGVRLN